jgi:hypothetical protein
VLMRDRAASKLARIGPSLPRVSCTIPHRGAPPVPKNGTGVVRWIRSFPVTARRSGE